MKTRLLLCFFMILMLLPTGSAAGKIVLPPGVRCDGRSTWTVTPHNSSPDDPQRIQAAIDLARPGDTVRLAAGTFDFSEFENVRIAKNLTLEGAWDAKQGKPLTTIRHGWLPVLIGRKTPLEKPAVEMVNGHPVPHLTVDFYKKFYLPGDYLPDPTLYNIYDDWTPVTVNVRQIAFDRPMSGAIYSSATTGGTIERINMQSVWPVSFDWQNMGLGAGGVLFYNQAALYWAQVWLGAYDILSRDAGTVLISGNLIVQDSVINGDYRLFEDGAQDEAGDLTFALYDPANPVPPGGDYARYVLQDAVGDWNEHGQPLPETIQTFWVKRGYAVYAGYGTRHSERGLNGGAVYSLYAQSHLTVRRNVMTGCNTCLYFVLNGANGVPFTASIENNRITPAEQSTWATAFFNTGFDVYNPFTGANWQPLPGDNIVFRNNNVTSTSKILNYWDSVMRFSNYGRVLVGGNRFSLESGLAITAGWPASEVSVIGNTVAGSGDYALAADWSSNGNRFLWNDLRGFTPAGTGNQDISAPPGQVVLLSDGNTVIGGPGAADQVVWDAGQDNTVIGMIHQTPAGAMPPAAGSRAAPRTQHRFSFMR